MKFTMENHRHHGWSLTASDGRYWNDGKKLHLADTNRHEFVFYRDLASGKKERWVVEFDADGASVTNTIWHNTEPFGYDQWTPVQKFCATLLAE